MEPSPRLTVRGLLDEALLAGARVVSAEADLDRSLTWVLPFGEVTGGYDELTGVAVYARPEMLTGNAQALSALAARGAVALLVDGAPGETAPQWPAGLVVVELDFPVGFAALNRLLAERSLMLEMHVMRYSAHVHSTLAGLLHRGAGMALLIKEVSSLSSFPAVALDVRGHAVAHCGLDRGAVADLAPRLHDRLAATPSVDRHGHHDTRVVELESGGVRWTCTASAIRLGKRFEGWVAVLATATGPAPRPHDLAQHAVVTEQATAIIGSEMLRQRSVDEAEERARGDFVQALVHGSFASHHEMQARAEYHDIDLATTFAVFVAPGYGTKSGATEAAGSLLRLARYAASVLPHPAVRSYVTVIGDVLVVVRSLRYRDARDIDSEIAEFAEAVAEDLSRRRGEPVPVAHGAPAVGADQIRESYRQARVALGIGQRLHMSGSVAYRELRGYGVLELVAEHDRSRRFVRDVLGSLRPGTDLYDTLVAYLGAGGNVNAAARQLAVHRNTMLSKLDRISRTLGMDVRAPESQFTVWLAIRLELLDRLHTSVDREINYR